MQMSKSSDNEHKTSEITPDFHRDGGVVDIEVC